MVVLGLLCIIQFASSITLVAINDEQRDHILAKSWVNADNARLAMFCNVIILLFM